MAFDISKGCGLNKNAVVRQQARNITLNHPIRITFLVRVEGQNTIKQSSGHKKNKAHPLKTFQS
jgi:hypothetical protein